MISLLLTIIEGYILSLFLSRYLSLKKDNRFIFIVLVLYILDNLIFNENAILFSFIQPLLLFFILLICIYIKKKTLTISDALVCLLAPSMTVIADLISLVLTSIILSKTVATVVIYNQYYIISSFISKILLIICYGFISYYFSHYQNQRHQWGVLIPIWIIVFILIYLFWFLMTNNLFFNNNTIYYGMLFLIIASILLIIFIYRIQKDNEMMIKNELEMQKAYYVQKNKNIVDRMYDDIQRIEHAQLYNLSHIKLLLQYQDYDQLNLYLDKNIDQMKKFRNIINTANPFFNYIVNQKINELLLQNSNIKVSCILADKDIPISKEQVELLISIIDQIFEASKKNQGFNISFYTQKQYLKLEIIFINHHIQKFNLPIAYKIADIEDYTKFSCLITLDA